MAQAIGHPSLSMLRQDQLTGQESLSASMLSQDTILSVECSK